MGLCLVVAEMPGIVMNNDISLLPVEPSPSQRLPSTCLADNTAGGQVSLNTQALGASFMKQGKLRSWSQSHENFLN